MLARLLIPVFAIITTALPGATSPAAAQDVPFLTDSELRCQRTVDKATASYLRSVFRARQNCLLDQTSGRVSTDPQLVDCVRPIGCDPPSMAAPCAETAILGPTGDCVADQKIANAEAALLADINSRCIGVTLESMGFPGFCPAPEQECQDTIDNCESCQVVCCDFAEECQDCRSDCPDCMERCSKCPDTCFDCPDLTGEDSICNEGSVCERGNLCQCEERFGATGTFSACNLERCIQDRSNDFIDTLLDFSQPPVTELERRDRVCQDELSRKASGLFTRELDERAWCVYRTLTGAFDPLAVDCRAEEDPFAPNTGRRGTDNVLVEAHTKVLRSIPNSCPRVDLSVQGFPNLCPRPEGAPYPLTALTECMFASHHCPAYRMLDVTNPATTKCGNIVLDFCEQCDDGNTEYNQGDFCRNDCSAVTLCADTDDDGRVTTTDCLYINQAYAEKAPCDLKICDVNDDGRINDIDVTHCAEFVGGIRPELECPGPFTTCGDGVIQAPEESCDNGETEPNPGGLCNNRTCQLRGCGDPLIPIGIDTSDALYVNGAAMGLADCDLEVCDVSGDGRITLSDTLIVLDCALRPDTDPCGVEELQCPQVSIGPPGD